MIALLAVLVSLGEANGQELLELARQRHQNPDTTLLDYRSELTTLVSVGWKTDQLAPAKLILASELASGVAWSRDDGLQVTMLGQRYVHSFGRDVEVGLDFGQPWFLPTAPGDSLRVLGSIEIPNRAAIHPFAKGAEEYYEYEITDSLTLLTPARNVVLVEVQITPIRGDEALVVGSIWVDALTGDVGAMQIRFVGRPLWDDDPDDAEWANRILSVSATIQQGLWETRYWLPHKQELELMVKIPFIGNFAVPIIFSSEFGHYDVNTGEPIVWLTDESLRISDEPTSDYNDGTTLTISAGGETEEVAGPDTVGVDHVYPEREALQVRAGPAGGGWEIIRPPDDSLLAYDDWDRPLEAPAELSLPSSEELERRAQELSPDIIGRKMFFVQYDRIGDFIRYDRVESLALGLDVRYDIPRRAFWSIGAGLSFGVADLEFKGKLDFRYDSPSKRIDLAGYSQLHRIGTALTDDKRTGPPAALRAFFLGRDDADYYRSSGAALTYGKRWGRLGGRLGVGWEDHRSVETNTQVAIPGIWESTVFPPNPPAVEGGFWRGDVAAIVYIGDWTRPTNRAELLLGLEGGAGPNPYDYLQPRAKFEGRVDFGDKVAMAFLTQGGWSGGDAPAQRFWGIGGLQTVRGFTFGTQRGDSYWTGRLELSPRRKAITPVLFGDIGWAGTTEDWPGSDPLWSFGLGASFLWGIFRTDLVFPKADAVWFEFYFAGAL